MKLQSALYLIPVSISDAPYADVLPEANLGIIRNLKYFIVENVRTARRFIKWCDPSVDISSITFFEINAHIDPLEVSGYLQPLRQGFPMGIMSEAGCPGVADPGALPVSIAQREGLKVIPLVGPSSILMALMASGFNGQRFAFNGYLPVDNAERERKIRELETLSSRNDMTQIFIETPYRNAKMMESLLKVLHSDTLLCVASAITDPEKECIVTKSVKDWKGSDVTIEKLPTIFLFYCMNTSLHGKASLNPEREEKFRHGKKKNFI